MKHAQVKEAAAALFNDQRNPFGAFSLGSETHLVACFDSDYPSTAVATKFISGANGEDVVRHSRISTAPRWWADDSIAGSRQIFQSLAWAEPTAPLAPGTNGIALPVHADRGQCGLVVFLGSEMALSNDTLCEIHAR
ncbi:MAG: helix-turn-helix transcriptional regulator, partial [Mesorhizobium sp.]